MNQSQAAEAGWPVVVLEVDASEAHPWAQNGTEVRRMLAEGKTEETVKEKEAVADQTLEQRAPQPQVPDGGQAQRGDPIAQAPPADPAAGRKVIRSGDMEFEVDSFDSAVTQVSKIVAEEGGFVSTTESDKLPNGKVKGRVVLRCKPSASTRWYLSCAASAICARRKSALRTSPSNTPILKAACGAARAMEERLLEIIKTGKGAVKDLLEAEKQLGVWRRRSSSSRERFATTTIWFPSQRCR